MKRIIPPRLFLSSLVLMLISDYLLLPDLGFKFFLPVLLGAVINAGAIVLLMRANYLIKKHNTEIHTFKRPRLLITTDIFGFSRNPIYLGFVLLLAGTALLLQSYISLLVSFLFFLVCNYWYIPFEENRLRDCFGKRYMEYKEKVRRWI